MEVVENPEWSIVDVDLPHCCGVFQVPCVRQRSVGCICVGDRAGSQDTTNWFGHNAGQQAQQADEVDLLAKTGELEGGVLPIEELHWEPHSKWQYLVMVMATMLAG